MLMKQLHVSANRHRRGTVIILVVAVLTLLVVMGTAYLVSSRAEKGTTRAIGDTINLDLARNGVMSLIQKAMLNSTARADTGAIYGLPPAWQPGVAYAVNQYVLGSDYVVYKCKTAHASVLTSATNGPPPVNLTQWQLAADSDTCFARCYDYPETNWGTIASIKSGRSAVSPSGNPGLPDQSWLAVNYVRQSTTDSDFCVLPSATATVIKRFNPSTGAYDIAYPATPMTTADVAVVDPQGTADGIWHLLPFSGAGGVRYRYAFRAIDTSRMANLNTGQVFATGSPKPDATGAYLTSVQLNNPSIFVAADATAGNALSIHTAPSGYAIQGRQGSISGEAFALNSWQAHVLGYERFGENDAAPVSIITAANNKPLAAWFDLSDELELRSYGTRGTYYQARFGVRISPAAGTNMWVNTLGFPDSPTPSAPPASANRKFYTTYSWDRNLTELLGKTYKWTFGTVTLPTPGKMMNLVTKSAADQTDSSFSVRTKNFAFLVNLLNAAGYSDDEAFAYALNYFGQTDPTFANGGAVGVPPVITSYHGAGVLIHQTGPLAAAGVVFSPAPTKTYMAYSAQPFLNEVALDSTWPAATPAPVTKDFAVELYNPYSVPLNISGWQLRFVDATNTSTVWYTFPAGPPIPANSYLVVSAASVLKTGTTVAALPGTLNPSTQVKIFLDRPYLDLDGNGQFMAVDGITYFNTLKKPASAGAADVISSLERANYASGSTPTASGSGAFDPFMCTCSLNYSLLVNSTTLGSANSGILGDTVQFGLKPVDRFTVGAPAADSGVVRGTDPTISNVGDLAGYMRICNRQEADGSFKTVADQLGDSSTVFTSAATKSMFPQEAKVFMDYFSDPRAQRFLSYVASIDRASDGADQLGGGTADTLEEVRIPGRINVNTAPPEVLEAALATPITDTTLLAKAVANIVAFRTRSASAYTYKSQNSLIYSTLPGTGIRSMAELLIPLNGAEGRIAVSAGNLTLANLGGNSQSVTNLTGNSTTGTMTGNAGTSIGSWAKLFTACTVRSDAFVVCGYMEAIRAHPKGTHDNAGNWYTGTTSDDPLAAGVNNLRVSKRRWVAIVDRSWCNYSRGDPNFVMPRVVAIKDLPQ